MSNGKPWERKHTSMLLSLYATHHDHEIAERTGHCADTVQRRRAMLGLSPYYGSKYGRWEDLPAFSLAAIKRAAQEA